MKLTASRTTLFLSPEAEQRIRIWTDLAAGEVSCLGMADEVEGGVLVSRVFLLDQTCGQAETEMERASVARLLAELDAAGEDVSRLRFWWHSHGVLSAFVSSQDDATIRALANDTWTAALVTNRAGDRHARLDLWRPFHVVLDELPVAVMVPDLGLRDDCVREFKERVTETPPLQLPIMAAGRLLADGRFGSDSPRVRSTALEWDDLDDLLDPLGPEGRGFDAGP